jgi:hypothetical protein
MGNDLQSRVVRNAKRRGVEVKTRSQWDSQYPEVYRWRLRNRRVTVTCADTFVSHITVTFDSGKLVGDFFEDMRTIERIGYERFRTGFSYNWGIDHITGMVGVGMPLMAAGSHTINDKRMPGFSKNQNYVARAAAWIGMPGMKPTPEAKEAYAQLLAAHIDEGALTPDFDFKPHSFFADKDCPTQAGRDAMPEIYRRTMNKVGR